MTQTYIYDDTEYILYDDTGKDTLIKLDKNVTMKRERGAALSLNFLLS